MTIFVMQCLLNNDNNNVILIVITIIITIFFCICRLYFFLSFKLRFYLFLVDTLSSKSSSFTGSSIRVPCKKKKKILSIMWHNSIQVSLKCPQLLQLVQDELHRVLGYFSHSSLDFLGYLHSCKTV